jgi:hypothetical protein
MRGTRRVSWSKSGWIRQSEGGVIYAASCAAEAGESARCRMRGGRAAPHAVAVAMERGSEGARESKKRARLTDSLAEAQGPPQDVGHLPPTTHDWLRRAMLHCQPPRQQAHPSTTYNGLTRSTAWMRSTISAGKEHQPWESELFRCYADPVQNEARLTGSIAEVRLVWPTSKSRGRVDSNANAELDVEEARRGTDGVETVNGTSVGSANGSVGGAKVSPRPSLMKHGS